jgi:hypothetical protein
MKDAVQGMEKRLSTLEDIMDLLETKVRREFADDFS